MLYLETVYIDRKILNCINGNICWISRDIMNRKNVFKNKSEDVFLNIELCSDGCTTEIDFSNKEDDLKSINVINEEGFCIHKIFNRKTKR